MNMKLIACYWFCLTALALPAQTLAWEEVSKDKMAKIFTGMSDWFKQTTNYAVTVTHASFESHLTPVYYEKSTGYFKKEGENYHSFLLGIHSFQIAPYKIMLDTANRTMLVSNIEQSIWAAYTLEDYTYQLNSCMSIKAANFGSDKKYRLEYGENYPLERYEFVTGSDGALKELVMYYRKAVPKDPENEQSEKVKPRLSITFSGYKKGPPGRNAREFDTGNFFTKSGNKLAPAGKYRNFKLIDQRLHAE